MSERTPLEMRADEVGRHLEKLAARTTRLVGQLRSQSKLVLDDLTAWRGQLEQLRLEIDLAGMEARDELGGLRTAIRVRSEGINCRLEESRAESAAVWRALRDGMDTALADLRQAVEPTHAAAAVQSSP